MALNCGTTIFGDNKYIKFSGGDIVAVENGLTFERLGLSDIRIPYSVLFKSRIKLDKEQVDYLLNYIGMENGATFVAIKANYDKKSVHIEDNYINWRFQDSIKTYPMSRIMVLTGTPEDKIKQLYLSNPSEKYPVYLDIMIASHDDSEWEDPEDSVDMCSNIFTSMKVISIKSHNEYNFKFVDDTGRTLVYINYEDLENISNVEIESSFLILNTDLYGLLYFRFIDEINALQSYKLIKDILEASGTLEIETEEDTRDLVDPVIFFNQNVVSGANGYNTALEDNFTSSYYVDNPIPTITKTLLKDHLIDKVKDYEYGDIDKDLNIGITIKNSNGVDVNTIDTQGVYTLTFDYRGESIEDVSLELNV